MKSRKTFLPWTHASVRKIENLHTYLSERLSRSAGDYLPRSITLFLDPEIERSTVHVFLGEMAHQLEGELQLRMLRRDTFIRLCLFSPKRIEAFLKERTDAQSWAIYYSRFGGLKISESNLAMADNAEYGVIPCSTMRNHGVAWSRGRSGRLRVWLATARKEGLDWDWNSDIGHESAHAAFAQVPLFIQSLTKTIDESPLSATHGVTNLSSVHLARILYFYSELAVVAVRGESRLTKTGLPVAEPGEMNALLELSDELAPKAGFRQASAAFARVKGVIDVSHSKEIYEIASPIMRIIPSLTRFINWCSPPDISTFSEAVGSNWCGIH